MLIVGHILKKHPELDRLGVFLKESVREGQICWMYTGGLDHLFNQEELEFLWHNEHARLKQVWDAQSIRMGNYSLLMGDMARFIAHSTSPVLVLDGDKPYHSMISTVDCAAGAELTIDYSKIDELFGKRFG